MRIGIFGGSFNPIHNAHVSLARTILAQAGLDEVWFMVSPQNPLKQSSDLLDESLRLKMVELALEGEPGLRPCDYEFHLPRPSYTWNTLQNLTRDFPDYTFYIIIGGDNWERFPQWAHHEDILRHFHIIVYPRTGSDISPTLLPSGVTLVDTPRIDITSTQIRQLIHDKKPYQSFVCEKVAKFIENSAVYANNA